MRRLMNVPGARLFGHLALVIALWFAATQFAHWSDPLMNFYIALVAMYAIALFGMVILVGFSGQVSLGNGALMAVGGYVFALTSMHWETVPLLGFEWNAVWSMVFAGLGGVIVGLVLGGVAARLRGPYLAGLTLGVAVGIPAIANRFPSLLGGDNGLILTVPYPEGGYQDMAGDAITAESPAEGVDFIDEEFIDDVTEMDFDDFGDVDEVTVDDFGDVDEVTVDDFGDVDEITVDDFEAQEDFLGEEVVDVPVDEESVGGLDEFLDPEFIIERWQASLALAAVAIVGFFALNLVRGRQGQIWRAVRDDSVAAAVSGLFPAGAKVSAFVVSSLFAAISGAVLAQILAYVGPGAFGLGLSLSLLVGVVLGGRVSLIGALIGAVLLVWLPEFVLQVARERGWEEQITNNAPNLIYGLLVVLVVLVLPGGVMGTLTDWARRLRNGRRKAAEH